MLKKVTTEMISKLAFCAPEPNYVHSDVTVFLRTPKAEIVSTIILQHDDFIEKNKHLPSPRFDDMLILCHGNAEDISWGPSGCRSYAVTLMENLKMNVLIFDYPGYGLSSNVVPSEDGMKDAIMTVCNYCQEVLEVKNLYIIGKSIGSFPALYAAQNAQLHCLRGVLLQSPFASGVRTTIIPKLFPKAIVEQLDMIFAPNLQIIKKSKVYIAIIHGNQDTIIPKDHSELLWQNIPTSFKFDRLLLCGSNAFPVNHNNLEIKCFDEICDLMNSLIQKTRIPVVS